MRVDRRLGMIQTSFAHDYGDMAHPAEGTHFVLHPGAYVIGGTDPQHADMGDVADARFQELTLIPKAPASPEP